MTPARPCPARRHTGATAPRSDAGGSPKTAATPRPRRAIAALPHAMPSATPRPGAGETTRTAPAAPPRHPRCSHRHARAAMPHAMPSAAPRPKARGVRRTGTPRPAQGRAMPALRRAAPRRPARLIASPATTSRGRHALPSIVPQPGALRRAQASARDGMAPCRRDDHGVLAPPPLPRAPSRIAPRHRPRPQARRRASQPEAAR